MFKQDRINENENYVIRIGTTPVFTFLELYTSDVKGREIF